MNAQLKKLSFKRVADYFVSINASAGDELIHTRNTKPKCLVMELLSQYNWTISISKLLQPVTIFQSAT